MRQNLRKGLTAARISGYNEVGGPLTTNQGGNPMKHKGTALLCAACLAFTGAAAAMPATTAVYAVETSGTCGENLT